MDESGESRRAANKSFAKFIPMPISAKYSIPKLELNKRAPGEWRDCQDALASLQAQLSPTKNSVSESGVENDQQAAKSSKKRNKFVQLYRRASRKLSRRNMRSLTTASSFTSDTLRPISEARLRESTNRLFIQTNCATEPVFNVVLYVEAPADDDLTLCHAMTELATSAIINFFHPSNSVSCYWIKHLQNFILDELEKPEVKAKFTRIVYLRRFAAMLVLSRDASNLLRHRDTCFLHSVAAALNINLHRLLVVQNDNL